MAADIRQGSCAVEELDDRRTLEYLDIASGAVLLVCVAPAAKDTLPVGRRCVPPTPRDGGGGVGQYNGVFLDEEEEDDYPTDEEGYSFGAHFVDLIGGGDDDGAGGEDDGDGASAGAGAGGGGGAGSVPEGLAP